MHDLLFSASGDPVRKYMKHLHSSAVITGTYTTSVDSVKHAQADTHKQNKSAYVLSSSL